MKKILLFFLLSIASYGQNQSRLVSLGTANATLTGTPTAPTATVGTNTTQIATTAFVLANSAVDANLVHLSGTETITGAKTFSTGNTVFGSNITHYYLSNPANAISWTIQDLAPSQGAFSIGTNTVKMSMRESGPRYISVTDPIESPDGTASNHLVNKGQLDATRPYKVYAALLTQTGTSAPTVKILENTIGSIVWTRINAGEYNGTLTGVFTADKSTVSLTSNNQSVSLSGGASGSTNFVAVFSQALTTGTSTDALMLDSYVEIRVYN